MNKRQVYAFALAILIIPILRAVPACAQGDKIIPHVVNGLDAFAQLTYRTKFDITNLSPNLSPDPSPQITKAKVLFYYANGTPWAVATDQGTVSEVPLILGASQTLRITTQGIGSFQHGYAVVRNSDTTSIYPEDYQLSVTVYYEVLSAGRVIETVSVPIGRPTVSWGFPVEIDSTKGLDTGFAIVNLTNQPNEVQMQLYKATTPASDVAAPFAAQAVKLPLNGSEKQARMLKEFFPTATDFRGILKANSQGPVAILALELTPVGAGAQQYATMVPAYFDALRHNTWMFLPQGYALDADLPMVDYFHWEGDAVDPDLEAPWDVLFQTMTGTPTGSKRALVPQQGATICSLGSKTYDQFNSLTQEDLRSLTYSSNSIDMSDGSGNLKWDFAFAIKTGLGQYAKARLWSYNTYANDNYADLLLQVFVYK